MILTTTSADEILMHDLINLHNSTNVIEVCLYEAKQPKFKFNDLCIKKIKGYCYYVRVIANVQATSFGKQKCYLLHIGEENLSKLKYPTIPALIDLYELDVFEKEFKHSYAYLKNL